MRFNKISKDAFEQIQANAGMLLKSFDPANPTFTDENIITATSGGIKADCVPTYSDWGEDIDNVSNNMKEFKNLDGWESTLGFTALGTSPEMIRLALGAADIDGNKITPRSRLKQTDFSDIWWVGDRVDGGFVACVLRNALSTGGLSLQTSKNSKGQLSVTLTGHVSAENQDEMPMDFYSVEPEASEPQTFSLKKDDTPEEY